MLFDPKERSYLGPSAYHEHEWLYLDRSGRPEAQRIRGFLNHWVSEYPEAHRSDLIAKLKCNTAYSVKSAAFELLLFALLRSLGCSVVIHPDLPNGSTKHPDFLAVTPAGEPVYVEAVLATEDGVSDDTTQNIIHNLYSEIEKIDSPNFFLEIEIVLSSDISPSGRKLRQALESWLSSLDPDVVTQDVGTNDFDRLPSMRWEYQAPQQTQKKWIIDFKAIPKKPEKRGGGQRVLGIFPGEARFVDAAEPIRESLKAKTKYYGELLYPLLVAVNVNALSLDRMDEMTALFGVEGPRLNAADHSFSPGLGQKRKGTWSSWEGASSRTASGAWIFNGINLWNLVTNKGTVYFNPQSTKPLPPLFGTLKHASAKEEEMVWSEGRPLLDVVGLPEKWP